MSLLQHDPDKRIDYETFFEHSFLDLEHSPTPESYQKAVDLVCSAVEHDTKKNFVEAFNLYCDSLRYFIPLINGRFVTRIISFHYSYVARHPLSGVKVT
jgi:serine/threonine-protein kinase ULK/ATG1